MMFEAMALNLKLSASMEFVGVACGRPVMDFGDSSSKLAGESYIFWSGRPTWRPYRKRSCLHTTASFFVIKKVTLISPKGLTAIVVI